MGVGTRESESLVSIHFSFTRHEGEDIQHLPTVQEKACNFFVEQQGIRNIFLVECADGSDSERTEFRRFYQQTGSYATAMALVKRAIAPDFAPKYTSTFLPLSQFIQEKRYQKTNYPHFFTYRLLMLDELARMVSLEVDLESHPPHRVDSFHRSSDRTYRKREDVDMMLRQGQLPKAVLLQREIINEIANRDFFRNNGYVNRCLEYAREAYRNNRSVRIFISLGEGHRILVDQLRSSSNPLLQTVTVDFSFDRGREFSSLESTLIRQKVQNPQISLSEEAILRSLMAYVLYERESSLMGMDNRPAHLCEHIDQIISGLTLTEVEDFLGSIPSLNFDQATWCFFDQNSININNL